MNFEWDPRKARRNAAKHRVTFDEAVTCFLDPLALVLTDDVHPERLILIGASSRSRLVLVVYAEREGDTIRVISARLTTRAERRRYEQGDV